MRSSHYKAGRFTPQASKLASYYGSFCEGLVAEISGTNRRLSADALRISQLDRRADARSPALGRWLMFRISELTLSPTGEDNGYGTTLDRELGHTARWFPTSRAARRETGCQGDKSPFGPI